MAEVGKELRSAMKPTIYNKTMVSNVTTTQALPAGTKRLTVQCRTADKFIFSYEAVKYTTIKAGSSFTDENVHGNNITVRLRQTTGSDKVAEIVVWV